MASALGYRVSGQNKERNADRPKAPAPRESGFEFWSWGTEAKGGKAAAAAAVAAGARQGPGKCDTFLELRGRDIPFWKLPTIRLFRGPQVAGMPQNKTKLFKFSVVSRPKTEYQICRSPA